jgi:hypothetical protein
MTLSRQPPDRTLWEVGVAGRGQDAGLAWCVTTPGTPLVSAS